MKTDREREPESSTRALVSPANSEGFKFDLTSPLNETRKINFDNPTSPILSSTNDVFDDNKVLLQVNNSHKANNWNKFSHQHKVSKHYQKALDEKYFPRFVKGLYFLFFLIFAFLVAGQIILTINLDYNTQRLRAKKRYLEECPEQKLSNDCH